MSDLTPGTVSVTQEDIDQDIASSPMRNALARACDRAFCYRGAYVWGSYAWWIDRALRLHRYRLPLAAWTFRAELRDHGRAWVSPFEFELLPPTAPHPLGREMEVAA